MIERRAIVGGCCWWCIATGVGCSDDVPSASSPGGHSGSAAQAGSGAGAAGQASAGASRGGGAGASATAGATSTGGAAAQAGAGGARDSAGEAGQGGEAGGSAPMVDCASLPTRAVEVKDVPRARAYHGIAFDGAGNLIGAHAGTLYKTAATGSPKVLAAGFSDVQGIDRFDNGDFAVVALDSEGNSSLVRVTEQGGQSQLASLAFDAYGVRVMPSGWVYVGQEGGLLAVNSTTKEKKNIPVPSPPRVMDYSPDRKKLYVGTLTATDEPEPNPNPETTGLVYVFDLDASGLPSGDARLFARGVGGGFHDGLAVDICGNLFIADFTTSGLYRVTPDGQSKLFHQWTETSYGHGVTFGSGVGGWSTTSIFQPQPYNEDTVVEVSIGAPSRPR